MPAFLPDYALGYRADLTPSLAEIEASGEVGAQRAAFDKLQAAGFMLTRTFEWYQAKQASIKAEMKATEARLTPGFLNRLAKSGDIARALGRRY